MTTRRFSLVLLLLLGLGAPAFADDDSATFKVGPVPDTLRKALRLEPFYAKHVDCHGFPILGSSKVSDRALLEAAWIVDHMTAGRRDVLKALAKAKVRLCVMAYTEMTTAVPEHKTLEPGKWWDRRARGLGPSKARPCVSCAEENLLAYPGDPYPRENILVHEFAHAIDLMALRTLDPAFESKLAVAYGNAVREGLWKGTYAGENKEEYWAEGLQSWFDTNRPPDSLHNHVDTRRELKAYDPRLAKLITEALGSSPWRYVHPGHRLGKGHLADYDPTKAPRFQWPEGLDAWFRKYEDDKRTGAGRVELDPLPTAGPPTRSPSTREETRILFMNQTDGVVELFWIDHGGKRVSYGTVNGKTNAERSTLIGHVWVVVDAKGKDIARFVAAKKPGRAKIRAR
ncbi:MAG: hypothetical protein QNJ98_05810 [Planctomycetota bacterium]|nr:hypothetical protein [Planctomycetota bacterium]